MTDSPSAPVVVAIEIDEPALTDRLAALLAEVPGLRLAVPGEMADVAVVAARDRPANLHVTGEGTRT